MRDPDGYRIELIGVKAASQKFLRACRVSRAACSASSRALCLAAAALLLAAAPATAGTVGAEPGVGNVYRAAPGEKNDVTVLDDHLSDHVLWYSIVELGAPLVVNEPCVAGSPAMYPVRFGCTSATAMTGAGREFLAHDVHLR